MSATRAEIIVEAWRHRGTPYVRGQAAPARGCDCAGLVLIVGKALDLFDLDIDGPLAAPFRAQWARPNPRMLVDCLNTFLRRRRLCDAVPGDVLLFRPGDAPQHLGILVEPGLVLHAIEKHGDVREHAFANDRRLRLMGAWSFPKVIE
jgi:cell wall-associated NlpC family hydrolase